MLFARNTRHIKQPQCPGTNKQMNLPYMPTKGEEVAGEAEEEAEEDLEEEEKVSEEETQKAKIGTTQNLPVLTVEERDTRLQFAQVKGCPEEITRMRGMAKEGPRKQLQWLRTMKRKHGRPYFQGPI